jgi:AraC family transcriptional regulator
VRGDQEQIAALAARLQKPSLHESAAPISVEVVTIEPFRLLAIRNVGDYAELDRGFTRLFELVSAQVEPGRLLGIYGIPHDDPRFVPAESCRFDCALAVGDPGRANDPLTEMMLGGETYARTRHRGDYDAIQGTIDALYNHIIFNQETEIGYDHLYIHYLDDPEEVAQPNLRSDVYLPLASGVRHV